MRSRLCSGPSIGIGTTIVQRVNIGPVVMESAVRVVDLWHRDDEVGFVYVTTAGHPERGASWFRVRRDGAGVMFEIETRSRPGTALTRLAAPFSRRFQRWATDRALDQFAHGNSP